MPYEIVLAPLAEADLDRLRGMDRSTVKSAIQEHLRHEPQRLSKSRIKRLRGLQHPQYRLRVGEFRVFYDVAESEVDVLRIIPKNQAAQWLSEAGVPL